MDLHDLFNYTENTEDNILVMRSFFPNPNETLKHKACRPTFFMESLLGQTIFSIVGVERESSTERD